LRGAASTAISRMSACEPGKCETESSMKSMTQGSLPLCVSVWVSSRLIPDHKRNERPFDCQCPREGPIIAIASILYLHTPPPHHPSRIRQTPSTAIEANRGKFTSSCRAQIPLQYHGRDGDPLGLRCGRACQQQVLRLDEALQRSPP
jgi:hypothetical protein